MLLVLSYYNGIELCLEFGFIFCACGNVYQSLSRYVRGVLIFIVCSSLSSSEDWKARLKLPAPDTRFRTEVRLNTTGER